ncbi:MAG: tandem-95 repeat protein [Hyphomicrobiales bacterium]|nr:MAG: tandem-95 repeat protein [Hyphomicrobiales bacterium]
MFSSVQDICGSEIYCFFISSPKVHGCHSHAFKSVQKLGPSRSKRIVYVSLITQLTGNANITGTSAADQIYTGSGNDTIKAGDGDNYVSAGGGNNTVTAGSGNDYIVTGDGDDIINAGGGNNTIYAGGGANQITTGDGNDYIVTGGGGDTINAGSGNNTILAGSGNNVITTGTGTDYIVTGATGSNIITTGNGNKTIYTYAGNDQIKTGGGNDFIDSGAGDDVLDAGGGSDTVFAGAGNDVFIHRIGENAGARDYYDGGTGTDTLRLVLTEAEWASASVRADITAFLNNLASATNQSLAGCGLSTPFTFSSTNLTVVNIEKLEVYVAGVKIDLSNRTVKASADVLATNEDATGATVDLLANDTVAQRVLSIKLLSSSTLGTVQFTPSLDGAVQTAVLSFTPGAALQALSATETATETLTYQVTDVYGVSTTSTVTITVKGLNDAATITLDTSVPDDRAVTEAGVGTTGDASASGKLLVSDVDHGEAKFQTPSSLTGTYGTFTFDATTGKWSYTLDQAKADPLAAGEKATDTLTVMSYDGTASSNIVVTITGTNDAPVITSSAQAGSVTEDGTLQATGQVSSKDVDHNATATYSGSAQGTYGSFVVDSATGKWTYTLANGQTNVQALAGGDKVTETFKVTVTDDKGATATQDVTVTINGTNDAAVIGTPANAAVTEDAAVNTAGQLTATGKLSIVDVDRGEAAFKTTVASAAGNLGALTLAADGNYTYAVDNSKVQYLGAGDTKTDTFTVTSVDGTTKDIKFTVTGVNDAAVIGTPAYASVTEDSVVNAAGQLTATGKLSIIDVDQNQAAFKTTVTGAAGNLGALTLAADGTYTYAVDNSKVQYLGAGETKIDTFTVTSLDGTTKDINFTIIGTNDAPVITSSAQAGSVTEDGTLIATGQVKSSDLDHNDTATYSASSTTGTYGTFAVDSKTGQWTYTLANDQDVVQQLAQGEHTTEKFTVTVSDGHGGTATQDINVTVNGTNDAPVLDATRTTTSVDTQADHVGVNLYTHLFAIDPDHGAQVTYKLDGSVSGMTFLGNYGLFFLDTQNQDLRYYSGTTLVKQSLQASPNNGDPTVNGNDLSIEVYNNILALAQGETATDTVTVIVTDEFGASTKKDITVHITGVNDAPVVSHAVTGAVDAGAHSTLDALTYASDVDHNTTLSVVNVQGTLPAGVTYDANSHTFSLDASNAAYTSLSFGQQAQVSVTYGVSDGIATTPQTLTWTVTGTNHAPTVVANVPQLISQAGNLNPSIPFSDDLKTLFTDADNDTLSISVDKVPAGFTLANGVLTQTTFTDPAVAGDYTLNVTANDGHGGTVSTPVTLSVALDHNYGDVSADPFFSVVGSSIDDKIAFGITGGGSTVTVNGGKGNDTISFGAVSNGSSVIANGGDGSDTISFGDIAGGSGAVTVDGGDGDDSITFEGRAGVNGSSATVKAGAGADKLIFGDAAGTSGRLSIDLGANDQAADTVTFEGYVEGTTITSFEVGVDKIDLAVNANTLTLSQNGNDAHITGSGIDLTLTGVGAGHTLTDFLVSKPWAAVIGNPSNAAVTEDTNVTNGQLVAQGTLPITDLNTGQSGFGTTVVAAQGASNWGSLTPAADGSYTYAVDDSDARVQALGQGQTHVDTFTVTALDGTTKDVSFTINGTNDAPKVVANGPSPFTAAAGNLNTSDGTTAGAANSAFSFDLKTLFSDADNDALAISLDSVPAGFTLTNGVLTQTSATSPTGAGDYTLTVLANDGHGGVTTKQVTLAVALDNDYGSSYKGAPIIGSSINDIIKFGEDAGFDSSVTVNSGDGSDAIIFGHDAGSAGAVTANGGDGSDTISFDDYAGNNIGSVTANGGGASDTISFGSYAGSGGTVIANGGDGNDKILFGLKAGLAIGHSLGDRW